MKLKHYLIFLILMPTFAIANGTQKQGHNGEKFNIALPGDRSPECRIAVSMRDTLRLVFEPELMLPRHGESIEFAVINDGVFQHVFSVSNAEDQVKPAEMMRKMPKLDHKDPTMESQVADKTARPSWRIMGNDTVVLAYDIPGHFEAGMEHLMPITVAAGG